MSRSGYSDDCEQWALIRWGGAVNAAIKGKRGQSFLRELIAALDAMPDKRLIAHELVEEGGACCALGAVALRRGLDVTGLFPEDSRSVAQAFGIADALAREITFWNDEGSDTYVAGDSEQRRWLRMRAWAARLLIEKEPAQ